VLGDVADVDAADRDAALGDVEEARDQIDQRALAGACGADEGNSLARLGGEVHILQHILLGFRILEIDMVEDDRLIGGRQLLRILGIQNGGPGLQHFKDALGGDGGTRQHDEDGGDDHEAHQHVHRILQEGHHGADLHGAQIDLSGGNPDDEHGDGAHQEGHDRHDQGQGAVDEQVDFGDVRIDVVKALLLHGLVVEGADHQHAVEELAGDQVEAVDQLLDDAELRQRGREGDGHDQHDDADDQAQDPQHLRIAQHLEQGRESHQRREQDDAQHHGQHLLDLLDVIGRARDQAGRAEAGELLRGEGLRAGEDVAAHVAGGAGGGAAGQIGGKHGADGTGQGDPQHRDALSGDVVRLHGVGVHAQGLVFALEHHDGGGLQIVI